MEFDIADLNQESIARYRLMFGQSKPEHAWTRIPDDEFMVKIGAARKDAKGVVRPMLAGLICFGDFVTISNVLPNYFLDYREGVADGSRWTDRVAAHDATWSGNIIDFYFRIYDKVTSSVKVQVELEEDATTTQESADTTQESVGTTQENAGAPQESAVKTANVAVKDAVTIQEVAPKTGEVALKVAPKDGEATPQKVEQEVCQAVNAAFPTLRDGIAEKCAKMYVHMRDSGGSNSSLARELDIPLRSIIRYQEILKQAHVLEHVGPANGGVWKFLI